MGRLSVEPAHSEKKGEQVFLFSEQDF